MEDTTTQFLADSGTVVPGGVCAEADEYTEYDDFLPGVIDFYTVDGVLQPASFNVSTVLVYYNRDHFEAAGIDPDDPPDTVEEMTEYAREIKDAGIVDKPMVLNMQPWFTEFWLTGADEGLVDNENGRGDGDTTAGAFDNEATRQLFGEFEIMHDEGLLDAVPGTEGQFDHYFALGLETVVDDRRDLDRGDHDQRRARGQRRPGRARDSTPSCRPIDVNVDAGPFPGLIGPDQGQLGGGVWYMTNTGHARRGPGRRLGLRQVRQPAREPGPVAPRGLVPAGAAGDGRPARRCSTSGPTLGPASGCRPPTRVSSRSTRRGPAR